MQRIIGIIKWNIIIVGIISRSKRVFVLFILFVCMVLSFGMDHINNLRVKGFRVLPRYHLGSEKLKVNPKKVELV